MQGAARETALAFSMGEADRNGTDEQAQGGPAEPAAETTEAK